ncbi:MAG: protease modulator HflC [Gammaproteobacteria bacterium]
MTQNKILITVALLLFIAMGSVFTVHQTEKAIKFQFGEIIKADYEPGIHFKIPLINNIKKYDARIMTLDTKPERFLTSEKKNVIVDTFVKWRIEDVSKFYTSVGGDPLQTNLRVDQILKDAARSEFSVRTINYLVSIEREKIRDALMKIVAPNATKMGIRILDIRVKRIDLPQQVTNSVYNRMEAERTRVARELRSQGSEESERIRADADKQREIILANAYKEAETSRGEGDAKATEIYADSFGQDTEFFTFYRSMSAYKNTFKKEGDMLVVDPDSDYFKYFKNHK